MTSDTSSEEKLRRRTKTRSLRTLQTFAAHSFQVLLKSPRWLIVPFAPHNQFQFMHPFKPKIRRYESLPSTNNEVARLAALGADEGLAVIAEEDTACRGRLQRTWISPKGAGLYFSILLRPQILVDRWPLITFIAALSVSDALLEACDLHTDIKWPNDLLA